MKQKPSAKSTECLNFSHSNLNDLEMTFKVIGKTIIKLVHEGNSYKYLDLLVLHKIHNINVVFIQNQRENQ